MSALIVALGLELLNKTSGKVGEKILKVKQNDLPFPLGLSSTWFIFSAAAMRKFVENPL